MEPESVALEPWCRGAPCGLSTDDAPHGGWRLCDLQVLSDEGWTWVEAPDPVTHLVRLCPGCLARDNPLHVGAACTRLIEEWEHEYGALCRVVVSPGCPSDRYELHLNALRERNADGELLADSYRRSMELTAEDGRLNACGIVGGVAGKWCVNGTRSPWPEQRTLTDSDRLGLAHTDAERRALAWAPPVEGAGRRAVVV